MATLNYYLKNKNAKSQTTIYLSFTYDGYRHQRSTGLRIEPKLWDNRKGSLKSQYSHHSQYKTYKKVLERIESEVYNGYYNSLARGNGIRYYEIDQLIASLKISTADENRDHNASFWNVFDCFLTDQKLLLADKTIKKYRTLRNKLKEYETVYNTILEFILIDIKFYDNFKKLLLNSPNKRNPLDGIGLTDDTVSKYVSCLKTFMEWSLKRGVHNNITFKEFAAPKKEKHQIITLSKEELVCIEKANLKEFPKLDESRDILLFSYYTGQRWSDVSAFKKEDIEYIGNNRYWNITTHKSKKHIKIPLMGQLGKKIIGILTKYNYSLPKISPQKYNNNLKELGQKIGLTRYVSIQRTSGSKVLTYSGPLYNFLSSHIARRSIITTLLEMDVPPTTIMKLTGHSNINTLMKYENTSQEALDDVFRGTVL